MATADNFTIKLRNCTNSEIKAKKFEYKDGAKWKTENMFGLDGHQKIEKVHEVAFTRNLRGIGSENTCFRVTYSHHIGGTKWSKNYIETTTMFKAEDNKSKTVTLTK